MDGVTTAIVGFIFVCVVMPQIVKSQPQFYAGMALILLVILLDSVAQMTDRDGIVGAIRAINGLLQIGAILVLVMSAGGISPREMAGNFSRAYEVMRRGEEEKEVIIPLSGQPPRPPVSPPPVSPSDVGTPPANPQ